MPFVKTQVNHVIQTTEHVARHQIVPIDLQPFELIDLEAFRILFGDYGLTTNPHCLGHHLHLINPDLFWNHLFGHIGWAVHHGLNRKAQYLTRESCEMILKNFAKFVSGIDFYHLPQGFIMAKNPESGLVNVLHYSRHLHTLQHTTAIPYPFALDLDDPCTTPLTQAPFTGAIQEWYNALQTMRILPNGEQTCSETALRSAFIAFVNLVESFDCSFKSPQFPVSWRDLPQNPITLIGRWVAVLSNPHLPLLDRQTQWQVLLTLRLERGSAAIRALSDHDKDHNPCTILLPQMNCQDDTFYDATQSNADKHCWGFRSITDHKLIETRQDFWRYIAFQPQRLSTPFYRIALQNVDTLPLIHFDNKKKLIRLLAAGTTRHNAEPQQEAQLLAIWKDVCSTINRWETLHPILGILPISDDSRSEMRNELVEHLCRLQEPPNFKFLQHILGYFRYHFSRVSISDTRLIELSNALNTAVYLLKTSLYQGCRFYEALPNWIGPGIEDYIELQRELCIHSKTRHAHPYIAAHISTFNIKTIEPYATDIAPIRFPDRTLAQFSFTLLHDIQNNTGLNWSNLYAFCQKLHTQQLSSHEMVLTYLETTMRSAFPDKYFEHQRQLLLNLAVGLTASQLEFIQQLNFSDAQAQAVKKIVENIYTCYPLFTQQEFEDLVYQFNHFTHTLTSTDFTSFIQHLAKISTAITDLETLPALLDTLLERGTCADFEYIFFRHLLSNNTESLLEKFHIYVTCIPSLIEEIPQLDRIALQNLACTCILQIQQEFDYEQLKHLLQMVSDIVSINPHIQHYVFKSFQHLSVADGTIDFIRHAILLTDTFKKIQSYLPIQHENSQIATTHTHIFYSLLAKYSQSPNGLIQQLEKIETSPIVREHTPFILSLISQLLNARQPLENIQTLVTILCSLESSPFALFLQMYQHPPYVPIQNWLAWVQDSECNIQEQYHQFLLKPFGARRLDYTFNIQQYQQQRQGFHGLIQNGQPFSIDMFTDELGERFETLLQENRDRTPHDIQHIFHEAAAADDRVAMICAAVEMLARTASQQDLDSTNIISQELNTTQVMALYALLTNPTPQILAEIATGEGKSRIMMILAACKAAQGYTVDFNTQDMQLVERDFFSYKNFFDVLNIKASILTLQTPSFLYQKQGVNFSDTQIVLLRNKSDIDGKPFSYRDEDPSKRCLLLDECDQFKQDKSKNAFNYGAYSLQLRQYTWLYAYLIKFMKTQTQATPYTITECQELTSDFLRYIHTHHTDPIHIAQLEQFYHQYPTHLAVWLHSADLALKTMQLNNHYTITTQLFPMQHNDGHLQMSRKILVLNDGRPAPEATFSDGLHQCLVALHSTQSGEESWVTPPECETQRTLYPITFIAQYQQGCVIGTSGTTRSTAPIADPVINYENIAYLSIPRERPLQRLEKNTWVAKDQSQQVQFIKHIILERLAQQLPLLFICKNDDQSALLFEKISRDPDLQAAQFTRVHSLTSAEDEVAAVQQAGQPNCITFSTAGMFSRGVDIIADNLYVAATYVPSIEDTIQIKGRTGRIGKPGTFQMIIDLNDPEIPLNGHTYNIDNEIEKYQKTLALESIFQEEASKIYAIFLEEISQIFLASRPSDIHLESWLLDWQVLLNQIQKDWEIQSEGILAAIHHQHQVQFEELFNAFTQKWLTQTKQIFHSTPNSDQYDTMQQLSAKIFTATTHQIAFFKPKRHPIKVQHHYDPSDDGQARIYTQCFAQTRATLSGRRRWFANCRAWQEGRGVLFPDLMATLHGERPLFANLLQVIRNMLTAIQTLFTRDRPVEPMETIHLSPKLVS